MGLLARLFPPRETAADRAAWIDAAFRTAAVRVDTELRAGLREARRSFDAAETTPWTDSWSTTEPPINDALAARLPTLWSRAAGLARNNEWAQKYLLDLDDNVLGVAGIALQIKLANADGSKDVATARRLEAGWARWGEHADVSGLSWADVEALNLQTLARRGELLMRVKVGRNAGPFGIQVQTLDPILIDVSLNREWEVNRVRMGIERSAEGQPIAYWLQAATSGEQNDYISVGRHLRVPAAEIIHAYLTEEAGQGRGLPWITVGARRLWLLGDFENAAAVASSNAAKRQGFFYTPSGEAPPGFADKIVSSVLDAATAAGKVLTPEEIQQLTTAAQKYNTIVPGQFDTLPHGTQFQSFQSEWPNIDAGGYIKGQLRGWAAARGMSYVTAGNDLEAVNYSSARVGILGEREHFKRVQVRLARWMHARVFERVLPYIVLADRQLQASRMADYLAAATWQGRRWQGIDPVKEAAAWDTLLKLGLTSRSRLITERGEDPDDIAAERLADDALFGPLPGAASAAADALAADAANADNADTPPAARAALRLAASRALNGA